MKTTKGLVYYTHHVGDPLFLETCRQNLLRCAKNYDIVSVSDRPIDFGRNFVLDNVPPGPLQIFKKILLGLEKSTTDIIFLIEHDILYHPSHFDFVPSEKNIFYYNRNRWAVDPEDGKAVFYHTNVLSLLVAHRELLIEHWKRRVELTEERGFKSRDGYSPPRGLPKEERGKYKTWMGEFPNLDIRHDGSFTRKRMTKDQFRSERSCRGWTESYNLPYWGSMRNWNEFLQKVRSGKL